MIKQFFKHLINQFLKEYIQEEIRDQLLNQHLVYGHKSRLKISETAIVNNAVFNLSSGSITIENYVFFGHNVSLLTGTHNYYKFGQERQVTIPDKGRDILIHEGVWIASNSTILAPCIIGKHSVVGANSLVIGDVPEYTLVAGVPAKKIKTIDH